MRTYTVKAGDTLSKIAIAMYGDMKAWPLIAAENQIANPNLISVGAVLKIPEIPTTGVPAPTNDTPAAPADEEPIQEVVAEASRDYTYWILGALGVGFLLMRRRGNRRR